MKFTDNRINERILLRAAKELSGFDLKVFLAFFMDSDQYQASPAILAKRLNCHRQQSSRAIKNLIALGFFYSEGLAIFRDENGKIKSRHPLELGKKVMDWSVELTEEVVESNELIAVIPIPKKAMSVEETVEQFIKTGQRNKLQ